MALSLKNALKAYERVDVAEIDCGGWTCSIKSFSSVAKDYTKEQARIRARGGTHRKAVTNSAVLVGTDGSFTMNDKNPYMLGSYEADVDFFVEYMLTDWANLKDDSGQPVPYSKENARELFLQNGKPAEQLLHELMYASLDNANFVTSNSSQAEADGKN